MLKTGIVAFWLLAIALACATLPALTASVQRDTNSASETARQHDLAVMGTGLLSAPVLEAEGVRGYVLARFTVVAVSGPHDGGFDAAGRVPEALLAEVAQGMPFSHSRPRVIDPDRLAAAIRDRVNRMAGAELLVRVYVEQFDYLDRGDARTAGAVREARSVAP